MVKLTFPDLRILAFNANPSHFQGYSTNRSQVKTLSKRAKRAFASWLSNENAVTAKTRSREGAGVKGFLGQPRNYSRTDGEKWSERQDLNLRRLGPKPSALARLSYAPIRQEGNI